MFFAPPQYVTFFAPLQYITFFAPLQYEVLFYIVAHVGGSVTNCGGTKTVTAICHVYIRGVQNMDMSKFCLAHKQIWFPKVPPFQKYQNYLSSVMISAAPRMGISRDRGVCGII